MQMENAFDRALEDRRSKIPQDVADAARWVVDTLEMSWKGAVAVFDERAEPALALAIFDRIVDRVRAVALEERAGATTLDPDEG